MTVDQIDLFEVNEAFAVVPMKFMKELGVPAEKVNVNGGAIAMGHPLGASGAMILGTLLDELERRKLRYGLATLCIGAAWASPPSSSACKRPRYLSFRVPQEDFPLKGIETFGRKARNLLLGRMKSRFLGLRLGMTNHF